MATNSSHLGDSPKMSYKNFYEDMDREYLEEDAQSHSDLSIQLSWHIRTSRTIGILSKLITRFRKQPILVDIGCAGTWLNESLVEIGIHHRYVGCDISFSYLRLSKDTTSSSRVVCDASSLPFKTSSVDIMASFETLEHLPTPKDAAKELQRAAKSYVTVSVPLEGISLFGLDKRFDKFTKNKEKKVQRLIERVGWDTALRILHKQIGAAHVSFLTKNRLLELFYNDDFKMWRIRGALFFAPGLDSALKNQALKKIYMFIERVILSRIHIFVTSIRWLPIGRIGNRYGILVMQRKWQFLSKRH